MSDIPKGCVYNLLTGATCSRGTFRCDRKHRPANEWRDKADKASWVLDNVLTVARRETRRATDGLPLRPEMWSHVTRLCESLGLTGHRTVGVLRSHRFDCAECGPGIAVDEDGCCRGCGADAVMVGSSDT